MNVYLVAFRHLLNYSPQFRLRLNRLIRLSGDVFMCSEIKRKCCSSCFYLIKCFIAHLIQSSIVAKTAMRSHLRYPVNITFDNTELEIMIIITALLQQL